MDNSEAIISARNLHVLKQITKILLLCARQNIAIRSKDDTRSNFIALLEMKAEDDHILQNHLRSASSNAKYTSPEIQNELLALLGSELQQKLVHECNNAKFFGFIADEATDCSNKEQISLCLRYVTQCEIDGQLKHGIKEDFVQFVKAESTTGEALANTFIESLNDMNVAIHQMRGQVMTALPT